MENYYNFAGMGNRADLAISGRGGFVKRIVAPTGSDDPFYYAIDDHYGASDHEVFNDWGVQVPGIMMITWPDLYYHTSQDIADKCDATQLKRVCFIGAAAAYTIASANESLALRIAGEAAGNGSGRIGKQLQRAMDEIEKAGKTDFESVYKRTKGYIEAAVINEKATVNSTAELVPGLVTYQNTLSKFFTSLDAIGNSALSQFESFAELKARDLGLGSIVFKASADEVKAGTIIPKPTNLITEKGYRGYSEALTKLDAAVREKYPVKNMRFDTQELGRLCNGRNSALDIKKLLDTQRMVMTGETDLRDIINYIYILKEAGLITL